MAAVVYKFIHSFLEFWPNFRVTTLNFKDVLEKPGSRMLRIMSNVNSFHSRVSVTSSAFSKNIGVSVTSEFGDSFVFRNESIALQSPSPDSFQVSVNFGLNFSKAAICYKTGQNWWKIMTVSCENVLRNN